MHSCFCARRWPRRAAVRDRGVCVTTGAVCAIRFGARSPVRGSMHLTERSWGVSGHYMYTVLCRVAGVACSSSSAIVCIIIFFAIKLVGRPPARTRTGRTLDGNRAGAARGGGPTPYIYAGEGRDRTLHDGTFRSEYTHRTEVKSKSERNYTRRRR